MALVVNPNRKYMFLLGMKTQNVVPMIMKLNHVTLSWKMDELALVKLLHDYTTKKLVWRSQGTLLLRTHISDYNTNVCKEHSFEGNVM